MPAAALALVLVAALLHATWNLAAKRAGGDHRFALISSVLVVLLWAPLVAWLGVDGAMDSSIVIRSFTVKGRELRFQAGGGIVADSDPAAEYDETLAKAAALMAALGGRLVEAP
jgi:hypothetical protein